MKPVIPSIIFAALLPLMSACSTTEKATDTPPHIVLEDDGSFSVTDKDGNPIDDPRAESLSNALTLEMARSQTLEDDEIWAIDSDGNLTHIQSGGLCPLEWEQFTLSKPVIFQRNGLDVGCNFQSQELQASFTFYFYFNQENHALRAELEGASAAMKYRVPLAKSVDMQVPENPSQVMIGEAIEGQGEAQPAKRDAIVLTEENGWFVKLRMTYPAATAAALETLGSVMLLAQTEQISTGAKIIR